MVSRIEVVSAVIFACASLLGPFLLAHEGGGTDPAMPTEKPRFGITIPPIGKIRTSAAQCRKVTSAEFSPIRI